MTDQTASDANSTHSPEAGDRPGGDDAAPKRERDFGDSAGYGSGGSTLDRRDVGDTDANDATGKHNPLDDVMDAGRAANGSS
jgi:hypothetical protein